MYGVNGYIKAVEGKQQELLKYLLEASNEMKQVEGNYCYIVGTSEEDKDAVFIYEVWKNKEAHLASLQLPVFISLIKKAKPIIAGMKSYPKLTIHSDLTTR